MATSTSLPTAPAATAPPRPAATIVIATHARPAFLADCVDAATASARESDDVIVVECCNPGAPALLTGVGANVRHEHGSHAVKCRKLNVALAQARSDIVCITDDDCRVPPGWVDAMVAPFANPAVGVVFGPVAGLSSLSGPLRPAPVLPGTAPPELWNYAHGASMAVRRSAVVDVGGFDERLGAGTAARGGEEAELVLRLAARGWTCAIADAPEVVHLDWRDGDESAENVLGYQRGSGAYLGAALRARPARTLRPLALRLLHEGGIWRDARTHGWRTTAHGSAALLGGFVHGFAMAPQRFVEPLPTTGRRARGGRPRVLWVTDEAPDRSLGGGNIRQAMLIDALAPHAETTVLLLGTLLDDATRASAASVVEVAPPRRVEPRRSWSRRARDAWRMIAAREPSDVIDARRSRAALRPVLERLERDADVVIVHHLYFAGLLPKARRARWLLHCFDVPSERARQELAREPGRRQRWRLRAQVAKTARYERAAVAAYDGVIAVSKDDAVVLGSRRAVVVPNGVALHGAERARLPKAANVLLPGTLSYRPNVLGARWFCDEVLPLVQAAVPRTKFVLAGRQPVAEITELARRPGVEVHADVPDMATWLAWARVVVVPLHVGTGTRLKALEAMAAGRPVVGTAIGLEGLGIVNGLHARVTDDPHAMATAIVDLLTSDASAGALAAAGRAHVEAHYAWERVARGLVDALGANVRTVTG